jgi:molybdopterin/thiamine biosynthesis adenylyltransferase/rhodanese-related sulfurtransferase
MSFIADYSRQLSLSSMSEEKQSLLIKSRALVFGAGGLGVAAISYLSAAGVGTITVVDFDRIEASNLHRQTIYGATDIGAYKAEVAASYIRERNPNCEISAVTEILNLQSIQQLCELHDIVLDCTDNQAFSHLLNAVCLYTQKKAVFANAVKLEGQLFVLSSEAEQPCFDCLWPQGQTSLESCGLAGVLGPVPGVLGCLQALEAIKLLTNQHSALQGHLLHCDFTTYEFSKIKVPKVESCNHSLNFEHIEQAFNRYLTTNVPLINQQLLEGNQLIDIRSVDELQQSMPEYLAQHIEAHILKENPQQYLDPELSYLLLCSSGKRSKLLSNNLQQMGYQVRPCRLN